VARPAHVQGLAGALYRDQLEVVILDQAVDQICDMLLNFIIAMQVLDIHHGWAVVLLATVRYLALAFIYD